MQDMYPLIIPKGFPEGLEEKGIVTSWFWEGESSYPHVIHNMLSFSALWRLLVDRIFPSCFDQGVPERGLALWQNKGASEA